MIPFVKMNERQKSDLESELKECNRVLASYHEIFKTSNGIKKQSRFEFFKIILSKNPGEGVELGGGVTISPEDSKKIARIKEIEWQLIQGFSRMISKIARKWAEKEYHGFDFDDLEGEALSAAVHSTIYFGKEQRYSTFIYHCVNRRLARFCSGSEGLAGVSRDVLKTKKEYQALRLEEGSTFDGTVQKMGLSDREIRRLIFSLNRVHQSCDEKGCEFLVADDAQNSGPNEVPFLAGILDSLELTDIERAVLDGFMNSPTGTLGLGSVARTLVNPKTNKPYTRMSFTYAWQRVKKKIQEACGRPTFDRAA